eukprot:6819585-Prymnesium_polylepis.2
MTMQVECGHGDRRGVRLPGCLGANPFACCWWAVGNACLSRSERPGSRRGALFTFCMMCGSDA